METEKSIFALGFFDGVHLGHGALLRKCREMADRQGVSAGVITFSDHPDTLVLGKTPALISTRADRTALMRGMYGMERVIFLPFDRDMMTMTWQDFFQVLCRVHHGIGFVCGEDFRFGKNGEGTAALLKKACEEAGMECAVIPRQKRDGTVISSTYIRELLHDGDILRANDFLGHPHQITGYVVRGRQQGRTWGFPTANIRPEEEENALRRGVYACQALFDGQTVPAVVNVGVRPTVDGNTAAIEAYLPGFSGDLYGKTVTVRFFRFLRPEQKFDDTEQLAAAIRRDVAEAEKILHF